MYNYYMIKNSTNISNFWQNFYHILATIRSVFYQGYCYNNKLKPWYFNKPLSRRIISIINRCRSGHYNLAASLAKCNLINDPFCHCKENQIQDVDHILWQSPLYEKLLENFMADLRKQKLQLQLASFIIFRDPTTKLCETLLKFLDKCNLQI